MSPPISTMIPVQLRTENFRFNLVNARDKVAIEKGWNKDKNYKWNDLILKDHLERGGNYGVVARFGGLAIVDIDQADHIRPIRDTLPRTFTVRTGKGTHLYFLAQESDLSSTDLMKFDTGEKIGDFKAGNAYVIGPGCVHESGAVYEVIVDRMIQRVTLQELKASLFNIGVTIGKTDHSRKRSRMKVKEPTTPYVARSKFEEAGNPPYLEYLPIWYRTHHRKRNDPLFRGSGGRNIHLRICATLKESAGEDWKKHAHHLTRWMFGEDYDREVTDYQLNTIDDKFYFREWDWFFFEDISPDLDYLTEDEREEIRSVYTKKAT